MRNSPFLSRAYQLCMPITFIIVLLLLSILQPGCQKMSPDENAPASIEAVSNTSAKGEPPVGCESENAVCEDCGYQAYIDELEEDESPGTEIILGNVYNNPYSISNMTAAYNTIYSRNIVAAAATHYYVRVKPTNSHQLMTLDSLEFELFDHPLNREVLQEGEYYPAAYAGLAQGEYPWMYTVVEAGTVPPPGIQYQVLEALHIPDDNAALEDEAFYRTGNYGCDSANYALSRLDTIAYYQRYPAPDPCTMGILEDCPGGGGGGGTPLPASRPKPSGMINFATHLTEPSQRIGASGPLQYVRIVGRRFFKIDKTYTDNGGNFKLRKRFPRKVTIIVKFKASTAHGQHSVRMQRTGFAIWKSMFPLKKNIGTYKGKNLNDLNYEFSRGSTARKRKTKLWLAAIAFNTTEETKTLLAQNNLEPLPDDIRFYMMANGNDLHMSEFDMIRGGAAPLLNQNRWFLNELFSFTWPSITTIAAAAVYMAVPGIAPAMVLLSFLMYPQAPDIYIPFKTSDVNQLTASKVSFVVGQQLGITWLDRLTKISTVPGKKLLEYNESLRYVNPRYTYNDYSPLGNGIDNNVMYHKGLVTVWQAFAQHLGHSVVDQLYGVSASSFSLQGKTWNSTLASSSNRKYLEEFDPSITAPVDYFSWIPVGLINDLMDNNSDLAPVVDNVSGFTWQDIQMALYNTPDDMLEFKTHLKGIRPGQNNQVDALFASYGY